MKRILTVLLIFTCFLYSVPILAEEAARNETAEIPVELVGEWYGTGMPKNGGPSIDLRASINADGSGSYSFEQAGYTESYPFAISNTANRFSVEIPADNYLNITSCTGTWKLEDDKLLLDITTVFANGTDYSYTAECEKAKEESTEQPLEEDSGEVGINEVLTALGDPIYRETYDALLQGEIIQSGSKGDTAEGVQQTLTAFGQSITVDGNVGPKTMEALNAVQSAFDLEQTERLDADGYARLMPFLLLSVDEDTAQDLLSDYFGEAYDYMRACAFVAQGRGYTARQMFEECGYGDWEERAAACVQPWPGTGVLYKNSAVDGSSAELSVQYNGDADTAMLVKIYTMDGVLARTMFIAGTGRATTALPAGTYIIKDGVGKEWYGEKETFGPEASYEIMTFSDGAQTAELLPNHQSVITVNVQEYNPDADFVGSEWESWGGFCEDELQGSAGEGFGGKKDAALW